MLPTDQKVGGSNPSGRASDLRRWLWPSEGLSTLLPLVYRISRHKPCHTVSGRTLVIVYLPWFGHAWRPVQLSDVVALVGDRPLVGAQRAGDRISRHGARRRRERHATDHQAPARRARAARPRGISFRHGAGPRHASRMLPSVVPARSHVSCRTLRTTRSQSPRVLRPFRGIARGTCCCSTRR
jgi:hypothetical protein